MVLTRLSHVGEVCPLSDHSYSDPVFSVNSQPSSSHPVIAETKTEVAEDETQITLHILDFPAEVIEHIFSYLTYKKLGDIRTVCKRFDKIGSNVLNSSFQKLQNEMLIRFQATKSQMPRRESARRKHPLARESDILEILHMRLTLLQMTFGKHIERKHCCFFAGEILDEVYRILRCIKSTPNMVKVFKITDELFDLSTMAMEYFKEYIEPSLPEISYFGTEFLDMHARLSESDDEYHEKDPLPPSNMVLRKRIRKIKQGMRRYNSQLAAMKRELKLCKNKIGDQNKQMIEYSARMEEYDKKFDESSRKFSTVLQELNKCKTELQYWRSKSPVHSYTCCGCCGRLAGESSASVDAEASISSKEEQVSWPGNSGQNHHSFLSSQSSSSSGVKNLEPLFDLESNASIEVTQVAARLPAIHVPDPSGNKVPTSGSGTKGEKEKLHKRFSSDDDDSDLDVNTVGKRVKERKRVKLGAH